MRLRNYTRSGLLLLFFAISSSVAFSQTLFIGADGGDWFTASNWSKGLPATGNDATVPNGKTVVIAQPLTVNFNIQSFGGINNKAALTLATNLVSGGSIINSGTLAINAGITLTSSGGINNLGTINNAGTCNSNSLFTNATTGVVNNSATWLQQAAFLNNGTFSNKAGSFSCPQVFTNNNKVENLSGASFKVDFGGAFTNAAGSTLTNAGAFSNLGAFTNTTTVTNTGTFTNNGAHTCNGIFNNENGGTLASTATVDVNGRINNKVGGTVTNSFNFNIQPTGYFSNAGSFVNSNTITTFFGGTFCNEAATGVITTNFGSKIVDNGYFKNALGAKISGNGSITTTKKFDNSGLIEAKDGSQVTIGDTLNNGGTFTSVNIFTNNGIIINAGEIQNLSGGNFTNNKSVLVLKGGKFSNFFEYYNKPNATTVNNGAFINSVRVFNESSFTNNAYLLVVGDFFNKATATLSNSEVIEVSEGSIVNDGIISSTKSIYLDQCSVFNNRSTVNNSGAILSSGLIFQRGTISGTVITKLAGFIQTAATSEAPICRASLSTGTDLIGEAKVYGQNPVLPNIGIDSCAGFQYFVDGQTRKVFTCAQVGTTVTSRLKLIVRTGDSLTCNIPITIFDGVPPAITGCPTDVLVLSKIDSAIYNWSAVKATDNCDPNPTIVTNIASGSFFKLGKTEVVITARDKYNNARDCRFFVTVTKVPDGGVCSSTSAAPVFSNCPANISVSVPSGNAAAVWSEPTVTGACLPIAITTSALSGSSFPAGVTTVTYNAIDASKKTSTCSFTVTVTSGDLCTNDNINPIINNCPANIFVATNSIITGAVGIWKTPTANDNCGGVSLVGSATSGSIFPNGTTNVTYTATDSKNNKSTCLFTVNVGVNPCAGDVTAPVVSNCPANITQTTTTNTAVVTWTEPTATDPCAPVITNKTIAPGSNFQIGTSIVKYQFSDKVGNTSFCTFNVTINNACFNDTVAPVLGACPADITVNAGVNGSATATWTNPTATDNCGTATVISTPISGSSFPIGVNTVTVSAFDSKGNKTSCTFKVTVNAATPVCVTPTTPNGWMLLGTFGNNTYFKFAGSDATFSDAKNNIASIGGRFPTITNAAVNNFIANAVNGTFWIGLTRNGSNWTNQDGVNATYFNWHAGEPNNSGGNENNVEVYGDGTWNDINEYGHAWTVAEVPCATTPTCVRTKGSISREVWTNITGNGINDLTNNSAYPNNPTTKTTLNIFLLPQNFDVNTGDRVRGFIYPPFTGAYKFTVYGDDNTNLYLSTDNKDANKQLIANVGSWTYEGELTREPNQVSQTINLVGGKEYYIELLHKQGGGGNNFGVLWTLPFAAAPLPITGNFLAPYDNCTATTPAPIVCETKGSFYYERWLNVNYNWLQPIVLPTSPVNDVIINVPTNLVIPFVDQNVNYLARARGYITAPESGDYYFNITGDDYDELWASPTTNATTLFKIAYNYGYTYGDEHDKYASQTSQKVSLVAGQKYYFDVRHYQGYGGDSWQVYWKKPSDPNNWTIIPSSALSYPCDIQKSAAQSQRIFDFQLTATSREARINWLSNAGTSADFYTVEKLNELGNFVAIYKISGLNGNTKLESFSFIDAKTTEGDNFYRIKTTFIDGTESLSEVKKVSFNKSNTLSVFPNPTDDFIDIDLSNYAGKAVDLSIYNALGKSEFHFNFDAAPTSAFRVETDNFGLGAHLIKVDVKGLPSQTKQFIIAR